MKKYLYILFFCIIYSCGDIPIDSEKNAKTIANDTYPFTQFDEVYRWKKNSTITIKLPDNKDITADGYTPEFRTVVLEALQIWKKELELQNITLKIVTTGPNDISVLWHDGTGLGNVLGYAEYDPDKDPSRFVTLTTQRRYDNATLKNNTSDVKAIAIHEFGHIFGIWSHSFDATDIMYPRLTSITDLSKRDTLTFQQAYEQSPFLDFSSLPKNNIENIELKKDFLVNNPQYNFSISVHCVFQDIHGEHESHDESIFFSSDMNMKSLSRIPE